MSLIQGAQLQASQPASAVRRAITRAWPELNSPAAWLVALILVIMPLIANGFFLIEIFGTTLILGIIALSLMFLAGYGGMVSLMQLTIAGFAGYMVAVIGVSAQRQYQPGLAVVARDPDGARARDACSARLAARSRCAPRASTPS